MGAVTCVNRSALVGEMNFRPVPCRHIEGLLIKTVDRICNNRRKQVVHSGFSSPAAKDKALSALFLSLAQKSHDFSVCFLLPTSNGSHG